MNMRNTVSNIMPLETIDELASFLQSQPVASVRRELLERFDTLLEYVDANEWATAVRICEALAITGWGPREQVDAISRFNGDCWETQFVTDKEECRFRFALWSRRKKGWTLLRPQFYASPDFPNRPTLDWMQHAKVTFPIVDCATLASQRNYRLPMPITMGMYGGDNETSNAAASLNMELQRHLLEAMEPAAYGDAVERFYFTYHCPALSESCESGLKIGVYNAKQKAFYSDLYFSEEFGRMSRADQRAFIRMHLLKAIDALAEKLKTREIDYEIAAFRAHAEIALESWNQKGS